MNVIAFLSQKGGSGKTTLSVHTAVAAEAGTHGRRKPRSWRRPRPAT
jgi:cellulose biosynthesis protein BcsQ